MMMSLSYVEITEAFSDDVDGLERKNDEDNDGELLRSEVISIEGEED